MTFRLFILFIAISHFVVGQTIKFSNVNVQNGLSNSWVKSIHKDSKGFIWFGTPTGLNRFDGYDITTYRHDPDNPRSLGGNNIATIYVDKKDRMWVSDIRSISLYNPDQEDFTIYKVPNQEKIIGNLALDVPIFEDSKGHIWVGNEFGLLLLDEENGEFIEYPLTNYGIDSSSIGAVYSIVEDDKGLLWFGTSNGAFTFDDSKKIIRRYLPSNDKKSLAHPIVSKIHVDENGTVWLATWGGGLHKYLPASDNFKRFQYESKNPNSLSKNDILSMEGNNDGKLYLGTENGGLNIFDIASQQFERHTTQIEFENTLSSNSIYSIYYDKQSQILWLGTFNGGVDYWSKWSKPFNHEKAQLNRLNNNKVTALSEDRTGNLYIGTDGGGLNIRSAENGSYTYFLHDPTDPASLMSNAVLAILEDSDENIWVGTYAGGVDLFNRETGQFTHFRNDSNDPGSLGGFHVSSFCEDQKGNLWVGTFDAGLSVLQKETNDFIHFVNDASDSTSLSNGFVRGIFTDSKGNIFVSTTVTLDIFNPETQSFSRFDPDRLLGISRTVLMEDSHHNLWIGSENGLYQYDQEMRFQAHYTIKDGLPDQNIVGIQEDDEGGLWLSTHNGLVRFNNPQANKSEVAFKSYTILEGLQGAEYKIGAYCKGAGGIMYFGGQNGFNSFDPQLIQDNPNIPPVVLTDLKVFNKTVDFGPDQVIPKPVLMLQQLTLDHSASVFTFEFAALEYSLTQRNSYAFIMEGFEEEWNYVGNQRSATYTNLDPGNYVFKVKASNSDGVWNDAGVSLPIKILPPFYRTWWFKLILSSFFIAAVILYNRMRIRRFQQSQKVLETKVKERTFELEIKNQELAEMSSQKQKVQEQMWHSEKMAALGVLVAGVAHEINNPTGFIKSGMEVFKKEATKAVVDLDVIQEVISHMELGVSRITSIVKSLNAFSRDDEQHMSKCEINLIINDCLTILHHQYKSRIEIKKNFQEGELLTIGNTSQLYQVFTNLFSNAIQAIPNEGEIFIETKKEKDRIHVIVRDTGIGIPKKYLTKVFDPFFTTKDPGIGTGLGLSIVYNIIERHEGSIEFNSTSGKGTEAKVFLKLIDQEKERKNG